MCCMRNHKKHGEITQFLTYLIPRMTLLVQALFSSAFSYQVVALCCFTALPTDSLPGPFSAPSCCPTSSFYFSSPPGAAESLRAQPSAAAAGPEQLEPGRAHSPLLAAHRAGKAAQRRGQLSACRCAAAPSQHEGRPKRWLGRSLKTKVGAAGAPGSVPSPPDGSSLPVLCLRGSDRKCHRPC